MPRCRITKLIQDPQVAARAAVIELLFVYVEKLRNHFESVVEAHDLTPAQGKVVLSLGDREPLSSLADLIGCDRSNVTVVVDRLEAKGLVVRASDPNDRRVRFLQPTPAGQRLKATLEKAVFHDVPGLSSLGVDQLEELRGMLTLICRDVEAP